MILSELLNDAAKSMPYQLKNTKLLTAEINGVTDNTELVAGGFIFVCIKGSRFDGHSAAEKMLEKGATCIVCDHDLGLANQAIVKDTRIFYGLLCAAWFCHPEKNMRFIGVTGTNGKTTMATLIKEILAENGSKIGFVGTTGVLINGKPYATDESTPTTPRVYELYKLFFTMMSEGCDTVVMEVSSFALDQNRIGPLVFDIAVFTNLTQDHLDYHGTMENYYAAKKLLFTNHCRIGIINIDDRYGVRLYNELRNAGVELISYALHDNADIYGDNIRAAETGSKFWVSVSKKSFPVSLAMMGRYNVSNAIAAIAACLKCDVAITDVIKSVSTFDGVRGRCEILTSSKGFAVICDYAHSPDALENMLPNVRKHTRGRLICLFGCGGDRDKTKRPLMAAAVEKHADMLVITSDNPRSENPDIIIDDIIAGLSGKKPYVRITDRAAAIRCAILQALPGDTIVLAGKGHENYQILSGDRHIHFDEREIVADIMREYKKTNYYPDKHESLTVHEILDAVNGTAMNVRLTENKIYADEIFSDTRDIKKGGMFVAFKGERFDGHNFVEQAIEGGAKLALTEHTVGNCPCIIVKNTRLALLALAKYYRMRFKPVVVGITGSVGKTTTKNMVALALSSAFGVMKTEGNRNNEIGMPFTLFKMNSTCSAAVIEMGMSDFGEIERLSETAVPNICLITNIGFSHIEKLGSQEGILQAKLEIVKGTPKSVPLIINGDDKLLEPLTEKYSGVRRVITYGIENPYCEYTAANIDMNERNISFDINHNGQKIASVVLYCVGRHNIYNALAAVVVADVAGADPKAAADLLSCYQPDSMRQNVCVMGQQTVIVDCYNASPTSMKAAIDMLCDMKPKNGGRRVAVLGDMLELGENSAQYHEEIGEYVVQKGVDLLVCYGNMSKFIAKRADELGMHAGCSSDKKMVMNFLKFKLKPDDIVLFKASRGIKLEEIINEFYNVK